MNDRGIGNFVNIDVCYVDRVLISPDNSRVVFNNKSVVLNLGIVRVGKQKLVINLKGVLVNRTLNVDHIIRL